MEEEIAKLTKEISELKKVISGLESEKRQRDFEWKKQTSRFEEKYLSGTEMDLSPGAAAIVSRSTRNSIAAFFLFATIGFGAAGVSLNSMMSSQITSAMQEQEIQRNNIQSQLSNAEKQLKVLTTEMQTKVDLKIAEVDGKVESAVKNKLEDATTDIAKPVENAYLAALDSIMTTVETERTKSRDDIKALDQDIVIRKSQIEELTNQYDTIYNDAVGRLDVWMKKLEGEIKNNPEVIALLTQAVQNHGIKNSWLQIYPSQDDFSGKCDYKIHIERDGEDPQTYMAAFVEPTRLVFYFSNKEWSAVNTHFVNKDDFVPKQWRAGVPAPDYEGKIYRRCTTVGQA